MLREGTILSGRYAISGRIGTGGMADVYKALDHKLNRYVAIKVLKSEFREDENFLKKFQTEAQSAAGLLHPNIVNIYDVGEDRDVIYIVMEYIDGITLKEYIQKKGNLTSKEVISIAVQVCNAMEVAHGRNIIHRDIKPQNIMITKEGKVKVTDFGIAKATSSNTISTNMMGSVHYTSPEQARGGFSNAKSDIYSLGISMYEMITGELPFDGDSTVSIALKHLQDDMPLPSEVVPDIPYSLERIIMKCTQKSPDRRYADITLLEKDLRKSLADPDGDFVVIAPLRSSTDTRKITEEELKLIQQGEYNVDSVGDDDDDDDDDYEARRARRQGENQKGLDPKMAKLMKILAIVASVIFLFLIGFGIATLIDNIEFSNSGQQNANTTVEVPELEGKTKEEAEKMLKKLGLQLRVKGEEESKKYEKGQITYQLTGAGAKAPEGSTIQVMISSGKLIEIEDVSEKEYTDASYALTDLGFVRRNITKVEEPHAEIEEGLVIRTEPAAGEWVTKDTEIKIFVSTGIEMVEVPDLQGMTKEEAEEALKEKKLVGQSTEEYSADVEAGKVISQSLDAYEEVEAGTTVDYVISKGPEPKKKVTVPLRTGDSASAVIAELKNLGLKVEEWYEPHATIGKDRVISIQNGGKEVEVGTTVKVTISTGTSETPETNPNPDDGEVLP